MNGLVPTPKQKHFRNEVDKCRNLHKKPKIDIRLDSKNDSDAASCIINIDKGKVIKTRELESSINEAATAENIGATQTERADTTIAAHVPRTKNAPASGASAASAVATTSDNTATAITMETAPVATTSASQTNVSANMCTKTNANESVNQSLIDTIKKAAFAPTVPVKNRYSALNEAMDTEGNNESSDDEDDQPIRISKPKKPPPIVIHAALQNSKSLIESIRNTTNNDQFYLKHTRNRTNIFFNNNEDYRKFLNQVGDNIEYHTYTSKDKKTKAFVIYNLNSDFTDQEIKEALQKEFDLSIDRLSKLKNTKSPIYLVTIKNPINKTQLNKQCSLILNTKITWDIYRNKREIIQCKRCQEWGHATSNCHAKARCLKCADNHLSFECTKSKELPAKCCNCGEDHPANSEQGRVYINAVSNLNTKRKTPKPAPVYKPVPLPTNNAWERRWTPSTQPSSPNTRAAPPFQHRTYEFPPLRQPIRSTQQMTTQTTERIPVTFRNTALPSTNEATTSNESFNDFQQLMNEMNKLNALTDIKFMLQAVRDLNVILATKKTPMEQFIAFHNFTQQLNG